MILDKNAAKNSLRFALKYKRKFDCPLILCNEKLEDVVCKKECKLAAIRDRNLADAILNGGDTNYELYTEGGE